MSTNFPTNIDTYITLIDNVDNVVASHINNKGDAITAIQTKLGVNSSAVSASIDYFLKNISGAYRTHIHDGTSDDGALIPNSSLIAITTADKVSGASMYLLGNIPAGAGTIPAANIPNIDGSKLVDLANITGGAGVIPAANLPTGAWLSIPATTGNGGKYLKVNAGGTAIEYADLTYA